MAPRKPSHGALEGLYWMKHGFGEFVTGRSEPRAGPSGPPPPPPYPEPGL